MGKSLLVTRPEHDPTTWYLSQWSKTIIEEAKRKGIRVFDLHREKANRERVIGILEKKSPKLVVLNGHGDENSVAGHDDKIILKGKDKKAIESKIIFARSCKSAKNLGQNAFNQGAIAYIGYKEDFWLVYTESQIFRPLEDKTAKLFLEPSNYVAISLLKGHPAGQANSKSKRLFIKNIKQLIIEGPSSDDFFVIKCLFWDMRHQVCLGDESATF